MVRLSTLEGFIIVEIHPPIVEMSVRHAPKHVPRTVESPRGKLVYLYLDSVGGATRTELQETLGLKAMTLFSTLRTLREDGLVTREDGTYVTAGPV